MALPDIAHESHAPDAHWSAEAAAVHDLGRLGRHLVQQGVDSRRVEACEPLVERADNLVADRRAQEADRAADPCARRHQHPVDADLLRNPGGVDRPATAESDERAPGEALAAFDRMDARGVGHGLVHHLDDAGGRRVGIQPQRIADGAAQGRAGRAGIEGEAAASEPRRVVAAQGEVRVGDRRALAAAPVAGRPRVGACGLRADGDAPQGVHMRQAAAAGADLDHLDDGNAERQAGALPETAHSGDLEAAAGLRLAVIDEAYLGGGAPHVERQHLLQPRSAGDGGGEDGAPGRAALDQADWEAARGFHGRQAAARQHQEQRRADAGLAQPGFEPTQVALHQRLHVGVRHGRGEPLPLAHLGGDFAG